ncbi:hypothetical protein LCGC14_0506320 [marine sediment metagenome]|uniref:Tyr recombinase domain-containing protein n=1 Tax=marine sediment metagenome TaxID=412755 RepID=A0A0F9SKX3_9ZZZZ
MHRPTNKEIIDNYLNFYIHSNQSISMRKSSLNYFIGGDFFNYQEHFFDITTKILKQYFVFLKNLNSVSIQTRKNKWSILTSFLNFTMEDYEGFTVAIPRKTISWNGYIPKETKINTNKDVIADKEEIQKILNYFDENNFKHYLIFRTFVDTGMRKGELTNTLYTHVNLKYRHFHIKIGKTGEKIYNFSEDLKEKLEIYLKERKRVNANNYYLFITKSLKKYNNRTFNLILGRVRKRLSIDKNITCKTFRSTLNTLRKKEMRCSNENAKRLLGHKTNDVNITSYTKYDYIDLMNLYDNYYPYKILNL